MVAGGYLLYPIQTRPIAIPKPNKAYNMDAEVYNTLFMSSGILDTTPNRVLIEVTKASNLGYTHRTCLV
jgi:hypothetical protein